MKLKIKDPCNVRWESLENRETGKFCSQCNKTIVDFSLYSDDELLKYFRKNNKAICGRIKTEKLNTELQQKTAYHSNKILATILILFQLIFSKVVAQEKRDAEGKFATKEEDASVTMKTIKSTTIPLEDVRFNLYSLGGMYLSETQATTTEKHLRKHDLEALLNTAGNAISNLLMHGAPHRNNR